MKRFYLTLAFQDVEEHKIIIQCVQSFKEKRERSLRSFLTHLFGAAVEFSAPFPSLATVPSAADSSPKMECYRMTTKTALC